MLLKTNKNYSLFVWLKVKIGGIDYTIFYALLLHVCINDILTDEL